MAGNSSGVLDRVQGMLPGPRLVAVLDAVDVDALGVEETFAFLEASARVRSWLEARELRALARVTGPSEDSRSRTAVLLGVTTRVSEQSARNRVELAASLSERLPATLDAFEEGALHVGQVRVIEEETRLLGVAGAREVEDYIVSRAFERTPASVRRMVKRRVLRVDPAAQRKRHVQAVQERSVYFHLLGDGMAEVGAVLPASDAVRCRVAIETAAQQRTDLGEGIEARRADAFTALLTGDRAPTVELILHASDRQPVTIPGVGPVDADTVRELLAVAAKVVLRPLGDAPAATSGYRPTAAIEQWVKATDPTCRFPHCNRPAERCDLDHVKPHGADGKTCPCNLMPLCRRHHRMKTFDGWTPVLDPDRSVTWTDPLGRTHLVPPPDS